MDQACLVDFCRLIPKAVPPKRADRSAAGYLPSRAMRYCDALTSATGYGYWVFPPIDLQFVWDGEQIFWSFDGAETWLPLTSTYSGAAQFPDFAETFDSLAPEDMRGCSPPFVTAMPEYGGIQLWTGLLARTKPGWSLSVRPPVNLPPAPGYAVWEGIVETDIWFGPLFTNIRLTKTDIPVQLRSHVPFLQVQPVPQIAYRDETLASFKCTEASALTKADWEQLGTVLKPHPDPETRQGSYAVTVRKRRQCPVDHSALAELPGSL